MAVRIPAEERLTNLVVALMATQIGLTRQQILENISGYRQRGEAGASSSALEKMFERDKDELRAMGVPLETLGNPSDPEDLREARYRIPKAEYDLPVDIVFSPAELAVLRLAGSVWGAGSLSDDARSGVRKIRALGFDVDEPIIGFAPRITARDGSFAPLQNAIERGVEVKFDYLKPGEHSPLRRHVRPFALIEYEARWHLHAFDVGYSAERTFLLSRIVGDISTTTVGFDKELSVGAGERAVAELAALAERQTALVEVIPGTEAALRLGRRAQPAAQGLRVGFVDPHIFADELASYGPEVRVIAPAELRALVIDRLRAIATNHADEDGA